MSQGLYQLNRTQIKLRGYYAMFWMFLFMGLVASRSFAHTPDGHKRIESRAYELLKEQTLSRTLPSGQEIFEYLVARGIINKDSVSSSAYPDMDLGRQFLSDRQIYHFMANSHYVVEALKNRSDLDEQKAYILRRAYPDCLKFIYTLFREVVDNNEGADQAGRGIYVLMHAIADSYSREHVSRHPETYNIELIKSWSLSRLFWPKDAKRTDTPKPGAAETMLFLHSIKGAADEEWQNADGTLSKEAEQAAVALKDLLVAVYQAIENRDDVNQIVSSYMNLHLKPAGAKLIDGQFVFKEGTELIKVDLTYAEGYSTNENVFDIDRYPQFSHMLYVQQGLENWNTRSFGYELGYHFTPTAAFSSSSWLKRIPYGFAIAINENTSILKDANLTESLQFKVLVKAGFYLPFNDMVLEPRVGYGATPFYKDNWNDALLLGLDLTVNVGKDYKLLGKTLRTTRLSLGYEYDSSGLHNFNSLVLKIGFNGWQARTIKNLGKTEDEEVEER